MDVEVAGRLTPFNAETPKSGGKTRFRAGSDYSIHLMLDLGAENSIAIGSDYDGCEINPELCGIGKMPSFERFLLGKGLGKELTDKIFFKNSYNFFKNILQK